nr:MAG TPA: hypothetical protein [Inoviridae sp.]
MPNLAVSYKIDRAKLGTKQTLTLFKYLASRGFGNKNEMRGRLAGAIKKRMNERIWFV